MAPRLIGPQGGVGFRKLECHYSDIVWTIVWKLSQKRQKKWFIKGNGRLQSTSYYLLTYIYTYMHILSIRLYIMCTYNIISIISVIITRISGIHWSYYWLTVISGQPLPAQFSSDTSSTLLALIPALSHHRLYLCIHKAMRI